MTVSKRPILVLSVGVIVITAAWLVNLSGLVAIRSEHGYYDPVWHTDGTAIYYLERRSRGLIVGLGWEHFTPPAQVYMFSDQVELIKHDLPSGVTHALHEFDIDPHIDRWVNRYHNRIFGWISTVIEPGSDEIEIKVTLSIPVVPSSEVWAYAGKWDGQSFTSEGWNQKYPGSMASSDQVLVNNLELMTVMNSESYGAAILQISPDNSFEVLIATDDFKPEMVTARYLTDRSRREQIEKVRRFKRVNEELIEQNLAGGMKDGEARLQAYDEMENMGLLPRSPRISAARLNTRPLDEPVFQIPADYFAAGLFKDIAAAIANPGTKVKASTGDHLKYYDDDVGVRLRSYRNGGKKTFLVETGDAFYRLTVDGEPQ